MDLMFKYAWIFLLFASVFFGYSYFKKRKKINEENEARKIENPNLILSEQEKLLNISLTQKSIKNFMPRVEVLIEKLSSTKDTFTVTAIEAIFIAEKMSDSLKLNDDGILVLELKEAKKISKEISKNPLDIIQYITAVEKKNRYQ
jgi:hypothetical protein